MNTTVGTRSFARGMSLVELMVAITIGLIILASVSAVFVGTKSNYVSQESSARLQETARFSTYFLMKDLRLVGHYGCHDDLDSVRNRLAGTPARFNPSVPIEGSKAGTTKWYPSNTTTDFSTTGASVTALATDCPNTVGGRCTSSDAITLRFADPDIRTTLLADMKGEDAAISLTSVSNFSEGDIVAVADCATADIVQVTSVVGNGLKHYNSAGLNPGNSDDKLSHAYFARPTASTDVLAYTVHRYYIGTGKSGQPALFRQRVMGSATAAINTVTEEMVEGVEKMSILYGIDTNSDNSPNAYLLPDDGALSTDTNQWRKVRSVRLVLTVRPVADLNVNAAKVAAATGVTAKDFATTVVLRNRQ